MGGIVQYVRRSNRGTVFPLTVGPGRSMGMLLMETGKTVSRCCFRHGRRCGIERIRGHDAGYGGQVF